MANRLIFLVKLFASILFGLFPCGCLMLDQRAKNPQAVGAVAESSKELANVITGEIPKFGSKKRILEVGAGTGVFTQKIIEKLNPEDHFDVVELMPDFCKMLTEKFGHHQNVTIYCGDILDWVAEEPYSYIVSGLPFNTFPADLVKNIADLYLAYSQPGTICSFFEYKWLPSLRQLGMNNEERQKYQATRLAIDDFITSFEKSNTSVYFNLPPAIVHFLTIEASFS